MTTLIESIKIGWLDIQQECIKTATGEPGDRGLYTHTSYDNSFVLLNETIPLPRRDTARFWAALYDRWAPYPATPWKPGQRFVGSTEPLDYCEVQSDEILKIAGITPAQLHYSPRIIAYDAELVDNEWSDVFSFDFSPFGVRTLSPLGVVAQFTMLGILGILPGMHELESFLGEHMIQFNGVALLGATCIITNPSFAKRWRAAMDACL